MTNWIKKLVEEAKKDSLCVRWSCSTCGSHPFKVILTKRCFQSNNIPFPRTIKPSLRYVRRMPIINDLLPIDLEFCIKVISKELATLSSEDIMINSEIIGFIIGQIYMEDYTSKRNIHYVRLIKEILGDTPAGEYLKSMEAHSKYVEEQRRKYEKEHSPEVVAEKRRIKKKLKAKAHAERVKKYKLLSESRKK